MPRIPEYTAKDDKLTPQSGGYTAWEGAGRRIAPAYNEAATLEREGMREEVQGAQDQLGAVKLNAAAVDAGAKQDEQLTKAVLSQYKDLFDIGEAGQGRAARGAGTGAAKGGGGIGWKVGDSSGGRGGYPASNEILNGAVALSDFVQGLHYGIGYGPGKLGGKLTGANGPDVPGQFVSPSESSPKTSGPTPSWTEGPWLPGAKGMKDPNAPAAPGDQAWDPNNSPSSSSWLEGPWPKNSPGQPDINQPGAGPTAVPSTAQDPAGFWAGPVGQAITSAGAAIGNAVGDVAGAIGNAVSD